MFIDVPKYDSKKFGDRSYSDEFDNHIYEIFSKVWDYVQGGGVVYYEDQPNDRGIFGRGVYHQSAKNPGALQYTHMTVYGDDPVMGYDRQYSSAEKLAKNVAEHGVRLIFD